LDAPITASEIESVIAKLQNNKAAGVEFANKFSGHFSTRL
jgi:hypothetical protein